MRIGAPGRWWRWIRPPWPTSWRAPAEQAGRERVPDLPALVGADLPARGLRHVADGAVDHLGRDRCAPTVNEGAAYTRAHLGRQQGNGGQGEEGRLPGHHPRSDGQGRRRPAAGRAAGVCAVGVSDAGPAVAGIFTMNSGVGPTMTDTGALFNATAVSTLGRGTRNLLTTALSTNAWAAVKLAMRKQAGGPLR